MTSQPTFLSEDEDQQSLGLNSCALIGSTQSPFRLFGSKHRLALHDLAYASRKVADT